MPALVLDASVALTWCFPDEGSEYAYNVLDMLEKESAIVPVLWFLEIANAIAIGERQKRLSPADVNRFLQLVSQLSVETDDQTARRALTETIALARAHSLSSYDASYLELAIREGMPIATLDHGIRKAARALGVRVV